MFYRNRYRALLAALESCVAYDDVMCEEPDPRAPTGDDYNAIMSYVYFALNQDKESGA